MTSTLVISVAAGLVVVAAVLLGRAVPRWIKGYGRFLREYYIERRTPTPHGQCARLRCTRAAQDGSDYCSATHEMDDAYNDAGY